MPWLTRNCLNRWCLRTLQEDCGSLLYRHLHDQVGSELLSLQRHQGQPPLKNACIAPHCDHWQAIDEEHGICRYRQSLSDALHHGGHHGLLPAGQPALAGVGEANRCP